jgi:tetrahydromethanopterin S-methyltransferase subunit C
MHSMRDLPKGYWGLWAIGFVALGWALIAFIWSFLRPENSLARLAATFVPLMIGLGINLVISLRRSDWKLSASNRSPHSN